MQITELILNNIRCFAGEQRVRLAPLTLLVGENSTGKSTVLGSCHVLMDAQIAHNPFFPNIDFNIPPYQMGSVANIARGKTDSFSIGMHARFSSENNSCAEQYLEFALDKAGVYLRSMRYIMPNGTAVTLHYAANSVFHINKITAHPQGGESISVSPDKGLMEYITLRVSGQPASAPNNIPSNFPLKDFSSFLYKNALESDQMYWVSMAPVRAQPQRVYEPMYSHSDPEGGKIPMDLMNLKLTEPDRYEKIRAELNQFGKASGLFDDISINRGTGTGLSFALQVKMRRRKVNLVDVGYGISQILPILVNMFADDNSATFLLQQPEVHLHPQAQAAFASLMVSAIKEKGQRFIVETHTDYLMQRASIAIRQGKIAPEDVSLVYFAPKNGSVTIHNIGFDEAGNLTDTPDGYRQFFMEETNRYMGFSD